MSKLNFTGWATRFDVKCTDGRVILKDAFRHNHGKKVPLVWNHQHNDPSNVIGNAVLEYVEDEGMLAHCSFNDTENGQRSQKLVEHGDITMLSIFANELKQRNTLNAKEVMHGDICEVSLVFKGANPEAFISSVIRHSDDGEEVTYDDEFVLCTGIEFELSHADEESAKDSDESEKKDKDDEPKKDETVEDVFNTLTDKQKDAVFYVMGGIFTELNKETVQHSQNEESEESEGGNTTMKQNAFDQETVKDENVLSHSDFTEVLSDAKRGGSMKEAFLAHGIDHMELLFPEEHTLNNVPTILGDFGWVKEVMNGVHKSPFSKIKALFADISAEQARARGYIKGKQKKEEVFALLKRSTSPQTVYKLQKMDRDDIIDITTMDVVAFIKAEMRIKLEEEIARAILIGDGRLPDAEEKIKEEHIRPIWTDDELYAIHSLVEVEGGANAKMADIAAEFIDQAVRAREDYDGSGSTKAYMAENLLTACLLLKDATGRRLYKDVNELATAMMVTKIVTVPAMKGANRTVDGKKRNLLGIIVNLNDYTVGADKGGNVAMFDDFDIDFNRYTYLIETRCSGSLMKPKSAIVLEMIADTAAAG